MKKQSIFLILFFLSITLFSQDRVLSFINDLKTSSSDIKDVIPVVDETRGNIAFFVADAKNVYGYKINSYFRVVDKMTSDEKRRKFKILIGYDIIDESNYSIFLTNKSNSQFLILTFSFDKKTVTSKEFEISDEEKFIQTSNYNNKFHLICTSKINDELYVYTFNNGKKVKHTLSTKGIKFLDGLGEIKKVNQVFTQEVKKFKENIPNTIEITSSEIKMFERDNGVIFSFNGNDNYTQLLFLDFSNYTAIGKAFKNPLPEVERNSKKSNSYINGDYLFTFSVSKPAFSFEINTLLDNSIVKSLTVKRDEEIPFKNTPIIQEGGAYSNYRELDKTKQFIRKIYSGNVGISVRKQNNLYHIVMGGYVAQRSGGMMMPMGFGAIPIASFGNVTVFFNPAQMAYNSFTNNKATRIESLFDQNLNHTTGDIPKNAFDKMEDFKSKKNKGSTVFEYQSAFIKTDYNSFTKNFVFVKFTD